MKKSVKTSLIALLILMVIILTYAKMEHISPVSFGIHQPINQPLFSNSANNGYDVVAYFTENKSIAGDPSFSYEWKDAEWVFSSEENKNLFIDNPKKYSPQFGGYCAFAVSKGFTANPNPENFEIIDDKLYLFAAPDVKESWMEDQQDNLSLSKENWQN